MPSMKTDLSGFRSRALRLASVRKAYDELEDESERYARALGFRLEIRLVTLGPQVAMIPLRDRQPARRSRTDRPKNGRDRPCQGRSVESRPAR